MILDCFFCVCYLPAVCDPGGAADLPEFRTPPKVRPSETQYLYLCRCCVLVMDFSWTNHLRRSITPVAVQSPFSWVEGRLWELMGSSRVSHFLYMIVFVEPGGWADIIPSLRTSGITVPSHLSPFSNLSQRSRTRKPTCHRVQLVSLAGTLIFKVANSKVFRSNLLIGAEREPAARAGLQSNQDPHPSGDSTCPIALSKNLRLDQRVHGSHVACICSMDCMHDVALPCALRVFPSAAPKHSRR